MRAASRMAVLLGCFALAACGGEGEDRPKSEAGGFPAAGSRTLDEIIAEAGAQAEPPVLAAGASVLRPGANRYAFGLFDVAREPLEGIDAAALYVARGATGHARGPIPVHEESLRTAARFRARSTAEDPDAGRAIFRARVEFPQRGSYRLAVLIRRDGRLEATGQVEAQVKRFEKIPAPGEKAPRIATPTAESVGGDLAKIDTRIPPSTMHADNLAEVLGRKPVVLLFATPRLCQTRLCGPVVDVAEQVKAKYGRRAAFIHMEVFRDNRVDRGPRPQFTAFGLETEPYLFVIDRRGIVRTAIENAFSVGELERAVEQVVR